MSDLATVNCGTCHACCHSLVVLFPERGDVVERYQTQAMPDGRRALLRVGPDQACVYLGKDGCTIHPNHPAVCRVFDCAAYYLTHTRAERRRLLKAGMYHPDIYQAGKERARERVA